VSGGRTVAKGDENALKEAVYGQPVMVGVDASHASFQVARRRHYCLSDFFTALLKLIDV